MKVIVYQIIFINHNLNMEIQYYLNNNSNKIIQYKINQ